MPSQGLSDDIQRSQSTSRIHRKAASNCSNSLSAGPIPPPYGVQSMLKTTTEIGNVQQFKPRTPHAQRPRNHIRPFNYRSSSFESSLPPSLRRLQTWNRRAGQDQDRDGERPPNIRVTDSILRNSKLSRNFYPDIRHYRSSVHSHHARSSISLRSPSPRIRGHRSLLTLRSHGDIRSGCSGSTSNRSTNSNVLHYYGLPSEDFYLKSPWHGRTYLYSTASRSPAPSTPAHTVRQRGNVIYNHGVNRSMSSLTRIPSPALSNGYIPSRGGLRTTRRGASDHHRGLPVYHGSGNEISPSQRTSLMADGSEGARYYDYTESFILEEASATNSPLSKLEPLQRPDQGIEHLQHHPEMHRAQTPFGIRIGSSFCPAELSTETGVLREATSRMECKATEPAELAADSNLLVDIKQATQLVPATNASGPVELDTNARRVSVVSPRSRASPHRSPFFPNAERSQRPLAALAARVHSPEPESKLQIRSPPSARFAANFQDRPSMTPQEAVVTPQEMIVSLGQLQPASISASAKSFPIGQRPKTSPLAVKRGSLEIWSPRPGRPVSSQSRKQFSRIIGLDMDSAMEIAFSSADKKGLAIQELEDRVKRTLPSNTDPTFAPDVLKPAAEVGHCVPVTMSCELLTPRREACLSMATSYGKSTVESLLDRHIECLGLMLESDSSSDCSSKGSMEQLGNTDCCSHALELSKTVPWPGLTHQIRSSALTSCRRSSMSSDIRMKLKPKRLFASMDGHISALPEPYDHDPYAGYSFKLDQWDVHSEGWQILPSTSQNASDGALSRPTLASGEMADIDTEVYPFGQKVWSLSQLSLPTTLEASRPPSSRRSRKWHQHCRSRSDITARSSARRRRQFRISMKQHHTSLARRHSLLQDHCSAIRPARASSAKSSERVPACEHAELAADEPIGTCSNLDVELANQASPSAPSRWSSLIGAMPMPVTGKPIFPRKMSVRTNHSQRSQRSQASLAEPLNSTRYRSQLRDLTSVMPVLASPDLGAPLDVSTFNLAVPCIEGPPLVQPPLNETKSYFHNGSPHDMSQRKENRPFGLRPLRGAMQDARRASALAKAGLPVRDGAPMAAIGPYPSVPRKQHLECYTTLPAPEIVPMSDFAYKKRKVVEKVRNWWRRQCMQKALSTRRRRAMQSTPGSILL